ncbi:MAG: hypothetical protein ABJB69_04935 [Spartobacteria bacterium]
MKRSLLIVISIAALCLLIAAWRGHHASSALTESPATTRSTIARSTSNPAPAAGSTLAFVANTPAPSDPSKAASQSERPRFVTESQPAQKLAGENNIALQKAQQGIREYRQAFRQNPVGTNAEITRALLGKNPRGLKLLPADAAVNAKGQLLDPWEQPVFFHQISGTVMEVRSAGPDHVMWNADDEILR